MIRTLTLNPALDRTVRVPGLALDRVNRAASSRVDPGGKGINVSKAVKALGGQSRAFGFLGGQSGQSLAAALEGLGILHSFVEIAGETRNNLKLDDPDTGTHTDINEAGPSLGPEDLARLEARLFEGCGPGDILVFSGSAPRGVPPELYAVLIEKARSLGAKTILDAEGELLRLGLAARPDLAKPNGEELERLLGRPLEGLEARAEALRALVASGVGRVVLSLGAEGALFAEPGKVLYAQGIKVEAVSTVGAGDSMVAALALALESEASLEDMVASALGAGTAAVLAEGSSALDPRLAASYANQVSWKRLAKKE